MGERFLDQAILSCINQTYTNIEIIIVNDNSPDKCQNIAKKFLLKDNRIKLLNHPSNQGVSAAFNTGFTIANGTYFTRLAQDDLFNENAIETMVNCLKVRPEKIMVYSSMELIDEKNNILKIVATRSTNKILCKGKFGLGLCWLFRKSAWERIGFFDTYFDQVEDYEYWMRASTIYNKCENFFHYDETPLLKFRQHNEMGSKEKRKRQIILSAKVVKKYEKNYTLIRKVYAKAFYEIAWEYRSENKLISSFLNSFISLYYWPFSATPYKMLLGGIAKAFRIRQ